MTDLPRTMNDAPSSAPVWIERWRTMLDKLTVVHDEQAVETELLPKLGQVDQTRVLAFVNAHAMNSAVHDASFATALQEADWVLRDGSGMKMLMDMAGLPPGINLNGTDLIPRILPLYAGRRILLLGTRDPQLSAAAEKIRTEIAPGSIVEVVDGFQPTEVYLERSRAMVPDLIVLAMGMPKQEQVAQALRRESAQPCLIVCGGAILDFIGGAVTRAPAWMRGLGIEWLYRLLREPRRLFMRYVVGNPLFLSRSKRYAAATKPR